uniref:Uncharacterized protein n=1 Tax=Glossina palpalis gambiensis TaxID=67801 RepID=A0A1B0BL38_9MUSC
MQKVPNTRGVQTVDVTHVTLCAPPQDKKVWDEFRSSLTVCVKHAQLKFSQFGGKSSPRRNFGD